MQARNEQDPGRLLGALFFLFVPIVLVLFLAQPIGTLPSLIFGVVLMVGHRRIAAPFSFAHRKQRCLWCGAGTGEGAAMVEVVPPSGESVRYAVCDPAVRGCRRNWAGLYRVALRGRLWIRLGILLPLLHLLLAETIRAVHGGSWVSHSTAVLIFQSVVALTVVTVSFAYLAARSNPRPVTGRFPFPVHNLTLLGAGWTLWVFRVVGIWWLIRVASRALV